MSASQSGDPRYSIKKAAKYLELSEQTIRIKIRLGLIRATKPGRDWKIRLSELMRYEESTSNEAGIDESLASTRK